MLKKFAKVMVIGVLLAVTPSVSEAASTPSKDSAVYKYYEKRGQLHKVYGTEASKSTKVKQVENTKTEEVVEVKQLSNKIEITTKANEGTASFNTFELEVIELTNAERVKAGLQPLQLDEALMNNAKEKSVDMKVANYFSHTSPNLGSPFEQMKKNGIAYKAAGENIAKGQRTPDEVVKAWMNSPGHRANILDEKYTHIGIGYEASGNIWTQSFIQK